MVLRTGIVGAGQIAVESHLPVLKSLDNVEVAAICDKNGSLASEAASRFRVSNSYDDFREMLAREKLDFVDICTPPKIHASQSVQAMEAGCHVLIEKPMATGVHEADEMLHSSKKNSVRLCVVHQNLCNPVIMKAKQLVETGEIGDLLNVLAITLEGKNSELCSRGSHWCHALPGGIFFEILPHPVYMVESLVENIEPTFVLSRKLSDKTWMKSDEVRVCMSGKNGIGGIVASCNSSLHGDYVYILGTKLALELDLWGRTLIEHKPHTMSALGVGIKNLRLSTQLFKILGSTVSTSINAILGKASAHYAFISRFVDSLLQDSKPPTTGEDGRENVRILEEICKQIT
nr:Gfo/Idh/MocA family oxidoreductase [Candidatus Njordarchaeum guaymaensis]